jgi:hypothetical protein
MVALTAGLAAGCGSDDEQDGAPIPADQAAVLERQLDSIQDRFEFGGDACADITGNSDPNTTAVASIIDSLPQNVDPDVRDSLEQSFERLFQLVQDQCDEQQGQETETEEAPVPPPETDTETTETVPPPEEEEDDDEGEDGEQPPVEPTTPEPAPEEPPQDGGEVPGQGGGGGALVPGEDG